MIIEIAETFFLNLAFGLSLMSRIANIKMTGRGFLRLILIVSMVSLILFIFTHVFVAGFSTSKVFLASSIVGIMLLGYFISSEENVFRVRLIYFLTNILFVGLLIQFYRQDYKIIYFFSLHRYSWEV